ncbi:MAG: hypothetical protein AB7H77_07885 [Bdellovibrionales bacterium]
MINSATTLSHGLKDEVTLQEEAQAAGIRLVVPKGDESANATLRFALLRRAVSEKLAANAPAA